MKKYPPFALKIIAYLSVFAGLSSLIDMLSSFMTNHVKFNVGVTELFVGIGLLNGSKIWRTLALLFIWFMFIAIPVMGVLILAKKNTTTTFKFLGQKISPISTEIVVIFGVVFLAYYLWQYIILNRKDVLDFFGIKD